MSRSRRLIPVWLVVRDDLLPLHPNSYARGKCLGRYPWLTRRGPLGPSGRLWVDVDALIDWARSTGSHLLLNVDVQALAAAAVLVKEAATT